MGTITLPHVVLRPLLAFAIAALPACGGTPGIAAAPAPTPATVSSPAPDGERRLPAG